MNSRVALLLLLTVLVPACGGGGSGGSGAGGPPATPPNPFVPGIGFYGEKETVGLSELYVTDLLGTTISKRSGVMAGGSSGVFIAAQTHASFGSAFLWSADNKYLAYIAEQDTPGTNELYVVPSAGGIPVKVSPPTVVAGGHVRGAYWSQNSQYLSFLGDVETAGVIELYVVKPDGTGRIKVSGTMPPGSAGAGPVKWSPDSLRLAFMAQLDSPTLYELYTVKADGTGRTKVSQILPGQGMTNQYSNLGWSHDGSRLAYVASQHTAGAGELYTVRPDGTENVRVNTPLSGGRGADGSLSIPIAGWSPDNTRIAYRVVGSVPNIELHIGMADGSGSVKVSGTMVAGGNVVRHLWAPDGSRLLYTADETTNEMFDVYTVAPDGTGRLKVSNPIVAGGGVGSGFNAAWFEDSARIAYWGQFETAGLSELFVCQPHVASSGVKVSGSVLGGGVAGANPFGDPAIVAFLAEGDTAGLRECYVVPRSGGTRVKISPTLGAGGSVDSVRPINGSTRLIMSVRLTGSSKTEFYSALPDGTGILKISGAPVVGSGPAGPFATW